MHFIDLALGYIPMWVYVVAVVLAIGATYPFWSPIWMLLPSGARLTIIGALAAVGLYQAGRYKQQKTADEEQRRREANARAKREEINQKVDLQSESETQKELSRWNRRED